MSKLINFNKDYKNTSRSVRNAVSQLKLQLGVNDGDAVDLVNNDLTVAFNANGTLNVTVTA